MSGRCKAEGLLRVLVAFVLPRKSCFVAVAFIDDYLPIATTEVVSCKIIIVFSGGVGYGSRSTSTLLKVLLKFASTQIVLFFLLMAKTELLGRDRFR